MELPLEALENTIAKMLDARLGRIEDMIRAQEEKQVVTQTEACRMMATNWRRLQMLIKDGVIRTTVDGRIAVQQINKYLKGVELKDME